MNGETGQRIPIAGLFLFLDIMTVVIAGFISQSNCCLRAPITLVYCMVAANYAYCVSSIVTSNLRMRKTNLIIEFPLAEKHLELNLFSE